MCEETFICVKFLPQKGLYTFLATLLFLSICLLNVARFWISPLGNTSVQSSLLDVYRRQLKEMHIALQALRRERVQSEPASFLEAQLAQLQAQLAATVGDKTASGQAVTDAEVKALQKQLAELKAEQEPKRKLLLSRARGSDRASDRAGERAGSQEEDARAVPRMSPTLERMPLVSDVEVWAKRPRKAPTFPELYRQLYAAEYRDEENTIMSFTNPYELVPHMNYPHSSMWLEGDKVMDRVFKELGESRVKFIVEAGSMHGGSAIRMAMELDKRGLKDVPILCIDPWTGDLNMWLNRVVWEHLNVRDGRATTYDQFMVNVRNAITTGRISPHHITPFPVSSIIGARWLQATGFTPQLIYLDSAHEIDETYYELCLYFNILEPGGILMGDDYGWQAVRIDVDRFVNDKGLKLNMFGVYYNWFVRKDDPSRSIFSGLR